MTVPVFIYVIYKLRRLAVTVVTLQAVQAAHGLYISLPRTTTTTLPTPVVIETTYSPVFVLGTVLFVIAFKCLAEVQDWPSYKRWCGVRQEALVTLFIKITTGNRSVILEMLSLPHQDNVLAFAFAPRVKGQHKKGCLSSRVELTWSSPLILAVNGTEVQVELPTKIDVPFFLRDRTHKAISRGLGETTIFSVLAGLQGRKIEIPQHQRNLGFPTNRPNPDTPHTSSITDTPQRTPPPYTFRKLTLARKWTIKHLHHCSI